MKYLNFLPFLFLFYQCNWLQKQPKSPETVVLAFVKTLSLLNFDEALTYCDDATAAMWPQISTATQTMSERQRDELRTQFNLINTATCDIVENRAECTLCCNQQGQNIPDRITLRLIDKRWRVALIPENNDREVFPEAEAVAPTEPNTD